MWGLEHQYLLQFPQQVIVSSWHAILLLLVDVDSEHSQSTVCTSCNDGASGVTKLQAGF